MRDRTDVVTTATLTAPVSPYGFGGTTLDGTILSDAAGTGGGGADLNMLGSVGAIPDWSGAAAAPPQPMVSQTRRVLDAYRLDSGAVREVVFDACGHSPHLERP
jgi:hypothetical protein